MRTPLALKFGSTSIPLLQSIGLIARLRAIPRHLSDEAIEWFSQEIIFDLSTVTWTECKRRMIPWFSHTLSNPIIDAIERRLTSRETIADYFNEKRRLLVKAGTSDAIQVELLTNGMPDYYKPLIKSREPKNASEWIRTALMFERKDRVKGSRPQNEVTYLADDCDSDDERKDFEPRDWPKPDRKNDVPPDPCPRCKRLGYPNEWHWKRQCTRTENVTHNKTNDSSPDSVAVRQPPICNSLDELGFVHIDVRVNSKNFRPFLDTGSKITCMSSTAALSAELHPKPSTAITLRQVDGLTRSKGVVTPRLTIGKITKRFPIHILPNLAHDMLLGVDAGIAFKIRVDLSSVSLLSYRHRPVVTIPEPLHFTIVAEGQVLDSFCDHFAVEPTEESAPDQPLDFDDDCQMFPTYKIRSFGREMRQKSPNATR